MDSPDLTTGTASADADPSRRPAFWHALTRWHRQNVVGNVDHATVLERIHEESAWSARYAFMTAMSAGIAILGLLLSSPAVIIGAMLVSPLMGPIIGLGFTLATFDWTGARRSLLALVAGAALAVALTAALVQFSPLKDMTPEILARTRPNLFDLLIAVFSALAGGYATIRGRGETIVGVAIATALMPPLAVVGFGAATGNMPVLTGSFTLFLTNFIAIALSAALVARFYGFGHGLTRRQTRGQMLALLALFLALAVPLALSLRQIAWEAWATRSMRTAVDREFGGNGRIVTLEPDFSSGSTILNATVLTDRHHDMAQADLARRLSQSLRVPVRVQLNQVLVNQGDGKAELKRARTMETRRRNDDLARADMAARIALVTGVPVTEVLVDPVSRMATAQGEAGQSLQYLMLAEQRLAADSPGWSVRIMPPAGPLPDIQPPAADSADQAEADIAAAVWALGRRGTDSARIAARQVPGETRAQSAARAERVASALREHGIIVETAPLLPRDQALERASGVNAARAVQITPLPRSAPESAEGTQASGAEADTPDPIQREA